jgi:hypothetical protein
MAGQLLAWGLVNQGAAFSVPLNYHGNAPEVSLWRKLQPQ